jgi:hypothetical protein
MNQNLRGFAALGVSALLLSAALSATAQAQTPAPPAAQAWKHRAHEHGEAKISALHDLLRIRPDQDAAFQAFVASMKPPQGERPERPMGGPRAMASMTTPQRLDAMAARMAEHQAKFQAHVQAVKTFYAALSPEQQHAFDDLHKVGMWGGGMGGGHGWGGGHGGPHPGGWAHPAPGAGAPPPAAG